MEHNGPPPDGVAEQLDFFLGGGPDCFWEEPPGKPTIQVSPVVEIPSIPTVCPAGFGDVGRISVVLTAPDGTTTRRSGGEFEGVTFPFLSGARTGRYHLRATAGGRNATASFEVRRAAKPRMWIDPGAADWGTSIDVYIGGFPPGRPADLHLYVCGPLQYRATRSVAVDARGEAHLILRTTAGQENTECFAMNSPLIFVPADPPIPGDGPLNQVFTLQPASDPAAPPNCGSGRVRC
ncbi:hypothetical protein AB0F81_16090 [Actinoplanes sp. NPDC024001]|uniref:hypothetical protein n=1 Tax=Actinoplanes sp. NPDC024001 TaxID=3154598 RepID=UPI0033F81602